MEERRKYPRYPISFSARCVGGHNNENVACEVIEISREGMSVKLCLQDKIDIDSSIVLEIYVPMSVKPIRTVVKLKWIREVSEASEFNYIAGGNITMTDPEDKWQLLNYAYDSWLLRKRH